MCLVFEVGSDSDVSLLSIHGCDLLSDDAEWDAPTWNLSHHGSVTLAGAMTERFNELSGPLVVTALWHGDQTTKDVELGRLELISLIKANRLGNFTRYLVHP